MACTVTLNKTDQGMNHSGLFFNREGGGKEMETWIAFITELSFPIAITFYLLHRIEGKLDVLNESIRLLPEKMK